MGDPDVAQGQLLDIARRVERGPVRLGREDQRLGFLPVLRVGVVGGVTEVLQGGAEQFLRVVHHRDPALDLLQDRRVEDHRPVGGVDAQLVQLGLVVADQGGGEGVGQGIAVALVEILVEVARGLVAQVRQATLVQLQQVALADQRLDRVLGRDDHVVAAGPGGQLGHHFLGAGIELLHQLAATLLLEAFQRVLGDVVVPVEQIQLLGGGGLGGSCHEGCDEQQLFHHGSLLRGGRAPETGAGQGRGPLREARGFRRINGP